MRAPSPQTIASFRHGVADSLAICTAVLPTAMLFGAVAVTSGYTATDAIVMSALVYAGASQLVAIDLFGQSVPAWSILLSVLAVNFRHVLYSAALTPVFRPLRLTTKAGFFPLLVDPLFAWTEKRLADGKGFCPPAYLGFGLSLYVTWVTGSAVGALTGKLVTDPQALALDMLLPIFFLILVMGFRSRPGWGITVAASAAASTLVYYAPAAGLTALGPPWHIMAGAACGILAAVLVSPGGKTVATEEAAMDGTGEGPDPERRA